MYRAFFVLLALMLVCVSAASGEHLDVSITYPDVVSGKLAEGSLVAGVHTDKIDIPGFSSFASSGDPALPCRIIYVALPPNADETSVVVEHGKYTTKLLKGSFRIAPVPPVAVSDDVRHWGDDKDIVDGRNRRVYESNSFYPAQHLKLRYVGNLRSWKVAAIEFWPYCYNPVTKKLRAFDSSSLTLNYTTEVSDAIADDPVAAEMSSFIDNSGASFSWHSAPSAPPDAATAHADYVIITTAGIASSSALLGHFADFQETRGHNVRVVTESEWGGGTGDTAAENIRKWLQENYLALGIKYVLLIGNPNPHSGNVPMKMLWPRNNQTSFKEAPSDYYYSDLTGNWDRDGDGYYGEQPDDFGTGGIDRIPDVYVGRIPSYGNVKQLDSILNKTISYGSNVLGDWSKRILLPMKPLDSLTLCYHLGERIRQDITQPLGLNSIRFYDNQYDLDFAPEYIPCSYNSVLNEWKQGVGMVAWLSHGASTYAQEVISNNRCTYLDDSKPAIVYAGSCNNGLPEDSNNLAYSLLYQGAVSTVSASRVSWYYIGEYMYAYSDSVGGLGYQYTKYILQQKEACGEAVMHAKLSVPDNIWSNHLVMNLYGDPSLIYNQVTPGSISGKVLNTEGEPVPGAVVRLSDGNTSVVSKEDGSFYIAGLLPGEYELTVSCAGYYSQTFAHLPVLVGRTTPVDFLLVETGVGYISGTVTDHYGAPISDALVTLDNQLSLYSGQDGTFDFGDIIPGNHSISVSKAPYAPKTLVDCVVPENKPVQVNIVLQSSRTYVMLNSGFEDGFSDNGIAYGWQFYTSHGYDAQPMAGSDLFKWGRYSQKLHMPEAAGEAHAGFYQTVSVIPGARYTLAAWQKNHFGGEESDPADNIISRVGYDPAGGTACFSPTIVWLQFKPVHDTWDQRFTTLIPFSDKITIFIEACRKQPGGGDDCYAWFDGVYLIGLAKAPSVPVVHVSGSYQTDRSSISASWTCSDPDIKRYEWAISTTADETGIVPGGQWTNAGLATSATRAGLHLKPGDSVRALVRAVNSLDMTGEIGASEVIRIVEKLPHASDLRNAAPGSWVRVEDLFVTRMGQGPECYLEDITRTTGIKTMGTWSSIPYLVPGTQVTVIGCVTVLDGMYILTGAELVPSITGKAIGAYSMVNRSVGLPINLGLLVTVCGRVTGHIREGFLINDGSTVDGLIVSCYNSVTSPTTGSFVRVTGISTPYGLAVYDSDDIVSLQE